MARREDLHSKAEYIAADLSSPTLSPCSRAADHTLSGYSQADLDKVALRLNQRPRKTLGFETPASKLQASVASTG
jgi:hypothetical protein